MKSPSYTLLPPDRFSASPFQFTYPTAPPSSLVSSIQKVGILTPLLCVETEGGPQILDGYRRLRVARDLHFQEIPVALLPPLSPQNLLATYLQAQAAARPLNPFEIAGVVENGPGRFHLPPEEIVRILSSELSGHVPPHLFPSLPRILSLPEEIRQQGAARNYSASSLVKISDLYTPGLFEAAARLLKTFSLSENQLLALLEWIDDITRRDGFSPVELLNQDPIPFLLSHPRMPTAKKRDAILKAIHEKRFPTHARFTRDFRELQQKITSVGDLKLVPPKDFMGERMELRIGFRTPEALRDSLGKASRLCEKIFKGFEFF